MLFDYYDCSQIQSTVRLHREMSFDCETDLLSLSCFHSTIEMSCDRDLYLQSQSFYRWRRGSLFGFRKCQLTQPFDQNYRGIWSDRLIVLPSLASDRMHRGRWFDHRFGYRYRSTTE